MAGANVRVRVAERLRECHGIVGYVPGRCPCSSLGFAITRWVRQAHLDAYDARPEAADIAESIAYAEPPILRPDAEDFDRVDYAETIEAIGRQVREDRRALCR